MPHDVTCHTMECCVIKDVKLFPTVNHRIYCRKFLTLSNQVTLELVLMLYGGNLESADNLCKQFGLQSGPTERQSRIESFYF